MLCAAVVVLWVRSYRGRAAVGFRCADALWQAVSERGRLSLDNAPQCAAERERHALLRSRLFGECVQLDHEARSLRDRLRGPRSDADAIAAVEAELGRVNSLVHSNRKARAAILAGPASVTPPVSHSAPHAAVAAPAAMPPVVWLALFAVRRVRGRRGRDGRLCPNCGYDLRATPERC